MTYCSRCLYKKRDFPCNKELKGDICRVCDYKFFIHQMLGSKNAEIEKNIHAISGDPMSPDEAKQSGLQQSI
jgi:hypothetical protein